MKVHVRVACARLARNRERMQRLRGGDRVREVVVDALEVGDDRAAERGDPIEDEEVRVAAGGEVVIEEDVDALGVARAPGHLACEAVRRGGAGGDDVRLREARVEPDVDAEGGWLREART